MCRSDECDRRRKGRSCLIIDDLIGYCGTTVKTAAASAGKMERRRFYACASHAVLSDPAVENIHNSHRARCGNQHHPADHGRKERVQDYGAFDRGVELDGDSIHSRRDFSQQIYYVRQE